MPKRDLNRSRRAKIVCTLGPSVDADPQLQALVSKGMDAARLNMTFGTAEEHARRIRQVRRWTEEEGRRPVAVIADLPGRKVRVGQLAEGRVRLEKGQTLQFVPDEGQLGDADSLPVHRAFFHDNLERGDQVLLSDGIVELTIQSVSKGGVTAEVVYGGRVGERTGVYAPGIPLTQPSITEADRPLLETAVQAGADYIAISWVADDQDLLYAREVVDELDPRIGLIAKIERPEAFSRLDGILRRADAIMIRRGDLGAQIEITRVPLVQKEVLRRAHRAGVPAILATQMLGSMIGSPRPTRAEASDVANAVAAGADGVMLSAETAVGAYAVEAVDMMARIIRETEREPAASPEARSDASSFVEATASMAVEAARRVGCKMIVCFTESGQTALLVSRDRPPMPLLAFCTSDITRRRLALAWGMRTDRLRASADSDRMVEEVERRLLERQLVETGETLVVVFGSPVGTAGRTNTVRLHRVGR